MEVALVGMRASPRVVKLRFSELRRLRSAEGQDGYQLLILETCESKMSSFF